MATYDYPERFMPRLMEWRSIKAGVQSRSLLTGAAEAVEFPAERFAWTLTLRDARHAQGQAAFAFFARLAGGVERLRLWCFTRPVPLGTMRGLPTLATAASRGDTSLPLVTGGTLRGGDLFKLGSQVFVAQDDCAPVGGVLTVPLVHRVRAPLAMGTAAVWDRPTFITTVPAGSSSASFRPGAVAGMQIELMEAFS